MNVGHIAYRGNSRFCSVNGVIDRKKMRAREFAGPVDVDSLRTLRLDRGAGPSAVVSPYRCRWEISMHLLLELKHFDFNDLSRLAGRADYRRDEERIDVAGEFDAASNRGG